MKPQTTFVGNINPFKRQRKPAQQLLSDEQIGKVWAVASGEHNASASVKRRITRAIEAEIRKQGAQHESIKTGRISRNDGNAGSAVSIPLPAHPTRRQ